jgi:TPR repeat protein
MVWVLLALALLWSGISTAASAQASAQSDAQAQLETGNRYYMGRGVRKDYVRAAAAYRRAAEQGLTEAQYRLARSYEFGEGVRRDEEQAVLWYRRAIGGGGDWIKREAEQGLLRLGVVPAPRQATGRGESILPCAGL